MVKTTKSKKTTTKKKQPSKTIWKTIKKRPNNLKNQKKFSKDYQPSAAAKSAGRKARKQGQMIMDKLIEYQTMTSAQLEKIKKKKGVTIIELLLVQYVSRWFDDDKMLSDLLNRHISYAPSKHEVVEKESFMDEDSLYDEE